jgi:hypothetical protein
MDQRRRVVGQPMHGCCSALERVSDDALERRADDGHGDLLSITRTLRLRSAERNRRQTAVR